MFMKKFLLMLVAALSAMPLFAEINGFGKIVDAYTRELMTEFQADLLRTDSTLIKSYFVTKDLHAFNQPMNLIIDSVPLTDCILYVTADGYYPASLNIAAPGEKEWGIELKPIMMNRIPFYRPKKLDEVTVTASKIKMVTRGDTIVYNAEAFALAKGSMLDGLIDQLPGVELKSSGKIYVNGKFVNELLVNGDNFFKGDPKIALENLPAYMVKDVQVYRRNEMHRKVLNPEEELPLVMDVRLKKQHQRGWIANAEAGYGTADRFLGRLFALMFSRDARFSVVANINNTNDDRKPGQTDNWNPNWQSAGRATVATAGIDYLWNSRLRNWKIEANLTGSHKKANISSQSNFERYIPAGNLFGSEINATKSRQWKVATDDKISFHVPRLWLTLSPHASFERTKADGINRSETANSLDELLNSLDESVLSLHRQWTFGVGHDGRWLLPKSPDPIFWEASVDWNDSRVESITARRLTFAMQPEQNSDTRPFELSPRKELKSNLSVGYGFTFPRTHLFYAGMKFAYNFDHEHIDASRDYYLMELVEEAAGANLTLPSVTDAMRRHAFIPSKSFDYSLTDSRHSLKVLISNFFPHVFQPKGGNKYSGYQPMASAYVKIIYAPGSINYFSDSTPYSARRRSWYAVPNVRLSLSGFGDVNYTYDLMLNNLIDRIPVADTANPLYIHLGNAGLKDARIHKLELTIHNFFFSDSPRLEATWRRYENLTAQSAAYDLTTGITTYRPVNVQGNWDLEARLNYGKRFRGEQWRLESDTRVYYQNSVDLLGEQLSTVRNLNLGENLRLTYRIADGLELAARGNAEWRRATSPMADFNTINAVDVDYGLILRATRLPWDMSFTTDLMMHTRRGYADSRLNDDRLVWNARLAKSILNGNLTFAIDGFDILGQLSNTRLTMNSQGRTETRYNTLPRYAMLHVIYRLNIQPKKQ